MGGGRVFAAAGVEKHSVCVHLYTREGVCEENNSFSHLFDPYLLCEPAQTTYSVCWCVCVCVCACNRWNSCRKNKQGAGIRAGTANPSQTPSPEGEKLHSDSGI